MEEAWGRSSTSLLLNKPSQVQGHPVVDGRSGRSAQSEGLWKDTSNMLIISLQVSRLKAANKPSITVRTESHSRGRQRSEGLGFCLTFV